tara:strand:+ start:5457 stop:6383 length:927 start_codon:yes stop_codon:yes gene_type:complete
MSANVADRSGSRKAIKSVQLLSLDGHAQNIPYFDQFGELGISSFAWSERQWFFSSGKDLYAIDPMSKEVGEIDVADLLDVHEMDVIDRRLWISNTGSDEVIALDAESLLVKARVQLRSLCGIGGGIAEEAIDKFHCNQVFKGLDGELYCLVHHVNGKQFVKRVAAKLIKSQGNGGVVRLRDGKRIGLSLHAPHTVTVVGNEYWVFDSGKCAINVYNQQWNFVRSIATAAWGRGAALDEVEGIFYAGMSAIRKRYLGALSASCDFNGVQVFSLMNVADTRMIELEGIEQVNNVYVIPDTVAEGLLSLSF